MIDQWNLSIYTPPFYISFSDFFSGGELLVSLLMGSGIPGGVVPLET